MADAAHRNAGQPIRIPPTFARQLEEQQLEICIHPCGCLTTRKKVAPAPSILGAVAYNLTVYAVVAIVAAYLLVQAIEAISFLLNPHIGMVVQIGWIAFLMVCGLFPPIIWQANWVDNDLEPVPLQRRVGWLVN